MDAQLTLLFREVADLPPLERERVFATRNVPPELRAEIESLLAYDCDGGHGVTECVRQAADTIARTDQGSELCGPYRLLRPLGSGGMGAVYLAERRDGEIEQRVAIKMLRAGADGSAWQERFLRERQLLAWLNHPSVARLFDAGRTERGQPYLVMEYVDGEPIDRAAAGKSLREQLTLFLRVCEGVAHAHRHLIIHRDLKPSNILVDPSGQPKLLDFGIAKLLDQTSDQTQTCERLLTPAYASPEQLRGAVQSTAADIYSLGAVLYKLLTGRSPHESEGGAVHAIDTATGAREIPSPRRLNPALPRDVECILQKALRIQPAERYHSVEAFAGDIRAFLESKPVQARSANAWYHARKFIRRYRVPVAAAALAIAALSAGLFVANRERVIAQRRFQDVRQLSNKLFDIDFIVSELPGSTKARQMIVDTSLAYLRRLTADVEGDPGLMLDVANAYRNVAEVEGVTVGPNLGQTGNAERDLVIAEGLIQSVLRKQPANRLALLRAAQVAVDRMAVAWQGGRNDGAAALARKSEEWIEKFNAGRSDKPLAWEILQTYGNVAHQYMIAEYLDEALRLSNRGIDLAVWFDAPAARAGFLDTRALSLRYSGDLEGALAAIRESVKLHESARSGFARDIGLSMALARQGWILGGGDIGISLGRTGEAIAALERAFQLADDLVHQDANDEGSRSRLFMAGGPLAEILLLSNPRRALEVFDHAYRDMSQISSSLLEIREVDLLAGSSDALRKLGRPADARKRLDQAFALLKRLGLYPAEKIESGSEADRALTALADYEADTGDPPRAIEIYEGLLERVRAGGLKPETSLPDAVNLSRIEVSLALLYRRAGRPEPASAMETRRLDLWRHWDRELPNNPFVRRQVAARLPR